MSTDAVREYYAAFGMREWQRLETAEGIVEFAVNTHFLDRFLPTTGRVLDLGGGPGRYAEWLAKRGLRVVLADASPELLEIARSRIASPLVEEIATADARDLSRWDNASFDAALLLGPLYHMPDEDDRRAAVREAVRVVRPGGTLFFALIPWYGFVRRTIMTVDECRHLVDSAFVDQLTAAGTFLNDVPGRFTHGWGARPEEVPSWFESQGLATITLVASEGLASGIEEALIELRTTNPAAFTAAMRIITETATDPSLLGGSKHLLYIATRT